MDIVNCNECKIDLKKNDDYLCSECCQYVDKYYCNECQIKHGCNKGVWESKYDSDAPRIEKLLKKFTREFILEVNEVIKDLLAENKKLKENLIPK